MGWRLKFPGRNGVEIIDSGANSTPSMLIDAILQVGYDGRELPEWMRGPTLEHWAAEDPRLAVQIIDDYFRMIDGVGRRRRAAAAFRKARRAHGARSGSIGRERPAWQRGGIVPGNHTRVVHAMLDPRVRGQIPR